MSKKDLLTGAVGGVAAAALLIGGQVAVAQTGGAHAVNAAPVAPPPAAAPVSFADIVARVAPAVVSVDVEGKGHLQPAAAFQGPGDDDDGAEALPPGFPDLRRFFGAPGGQPQRPQPMRGTGSGFFVSSDGFIVTNNHVVEGADTITVRTNDDRTLKAHLVGRDPATDLAVIKVDGGGFPFVSFEDRAKPRVGDWVVAVGNPFNLGGTATAGIVSALARANVSGSSYVDYMQIDAPINRGNSGGPTFDLYGRVVGVNSAIFSPTGGSVGIGFDIPADVAAQVTKQLISHGKIVRGFIGATVQDVTPEIADSLGIPAKSGALVADVTSGGPSARAGLRSGDIVTEVDGTPIKGASELTRRVGLLQPGQSVKLLVRRDGKLQAMTLTSGVRPAEDQLASNDRVAPGAARGGQSGGLGLMVSPAPGGLKVEGVDPDSDAAAKGIRPGDLIEEVAGKPATSAEAVKAAVQAAKAGGRSSVLVRAKRGDQHLFLALKATNEKG
jgi:serine protease Do